MHAADDSTIREALAIRSDALALLSTADSFDIRRLASAREPAWRLFLGAECCAAPVAAALRRQRSFDQLPSATIAVLRAFESRELQRSLSARAQLRQIDLVALACGTLPTVLKGGAMAGEGAVIDLGDIDIATDADGRDALATALLGAGYAMRWPVARTVDAWGTDSRQPSPAFGRHLPALVIRGGLPVELHISRAPLVSLHLSPDHAQPAEPETTPAATTTPALPESVRPMRGFRSLVRRVGGANLRDMLRHVVVQHPFRRGHLRDLVVLADAIGACTASELAAVRKDCRGDRHGDELVAMLDQSTALATGAPITDPEPTRQMVARKYALVSGREAWLAHAVPRWPARLAYVPLERVSLQRYELASLLGDLERDHPLYQLASIRTRAPRLADLVGAAMAAGYRVLLAGAIVTAGPLIRRRVRRLLDDSSVAASAEGSIDGSVGLQLPQRSLIG